MQEAKSMLSFLGILIDIQCRFKTNNKIQMSRSILKFFLILIFNQSRYIKNILNEL